MPKFHSKCDHLFYMVLKIYLGVWGKSGFSENLPKNDILKTTKNGHFLVR